MLRARVVSVSLLLFATGCAVYERAALDPEEEWKRVKAARLEDLIAAPREDQESAIKEFPPFDYSNGLSQDEAAGLAVVLNPSLRSARLDRGIAEGQLVGAGLLPNPEIASKWLVPVGGASWRGEVDTLFDLTQALLRRGLEKERARIRIEEVSWEVAAMEWQVASDTRLAFVDMLYWDEALKLFEEQRQVRERTLLTVKEKQARGASTILEALVVETELADVERQGKRIAGERKQALQRLNRLLGLPPDHVTRLDKPERPLTYTAVTEKRDLLIDELKTRSLDVLVAAKSYEGAEKELQLACWKQFPRFRLGPSWEQSDDRNLLGFNLAIELPLFDRNQGEIAVKRAEREKRRRHYVARLKEALADYHLAWTQLETLDGELKHFVEEVIPRLEKSLELTEQAFKAGEITVLEVLQLERRLLDTRSEMLKSLRDFHRAKVEVERATGPKLPPSGS